MKVRAFSLIEILVALSLTGLMAGIITTSYRNYNYRQRVETGTDRLVQVLNTAKANASAQKMDCEVCGGSNDICDGQDDLPLRGWQVRIGGGSYRVRGICGNNQYFWVTTENFPAGVGLLSATTPIILFKPQGAGTNLTSNLTLTITGYGFTNQVVIEPSGLARRL